MTKRKELLKHYQSVLEAPKSAPLPGSAILKNNVYEAYCRYRAQALPRFVAYREALIRQSRGRYKTQDPKHLEITAERLERKPAIIARLQYLNERAIDGISQKRLRLEEQLWGMVKANVRDYFEQYQEPALDKNGNPITNADGTPKLRTRERPRLLTELPPELAALVEDVTIDSKGRAIPKLYNKLAANKELRAMLDIGRSSDGKGDVSRLSDAELVAQLADQARALGVNIDLNYRFAQPVNPSLRDIDGQVIDNASDSAPRANGGLKADGE